jgi:hypothetical protein
MTDVLLVGQGHEKMRTESLIFWSVMVLSSRLIRKEKVKFREIQSWLTEAQDLQ